MKRAIIIMFSLITCLITSAQIVFESSYNVNGMHFSSLCVINANSDYGKCHVISNMGSCWFDAYYQNNGDYTTITMSNPSEYGWIAGTFYFLSNGTDYVAFAGRKFLLYSSLVSQNNWSKKMAQYGFNSVNFNSKPYYAECSHCQCERYSRKSASDSYCKRCEEYGHYHALPKSHIIRH